MRGIVSLCVVAALAAPVAAQTPYDGDAIPFSPWADQFSAGGSQQIVPLGVGNSGLQLTSAGAADSYAQYLAINTDIETTLSARFRLDQTDGLPHLLQLSVNNQGSSHLFDPTLCLGVFETPAGKAFGLGSIDGVAHYSVSLGPLDTAFHTIELYIQRDTNKLKALWDGVLVLDLAASYNDSDAFPGIIAFGAGVLGKGAANTICTFDWVRFDSGDTTTPEPAALSMLLIGATLLRRRRAV